MVLAMVISSKGRILLFSSVFTVSVILIWKYLSARKRREITDSAHRSGGLRRPAPHLPLSRRRPISQLLTRYDVTLVDSEYDCEQFLAEKVPRAPLIIGLDCEWVNREGVSSAPVALLQLSFPNGRCLLARVFKMTALGPRLTDLLTDKSILKLGVGIETDVQRLLAGFGVQTSGYVDLQHIAVRSGVRGNTGLQSLSRELLSVEMDKAFHVQCGNWEAEDLTERQVNYAAADAIVALHIIQSLVELKLARQDKRESLAGLSEEANVSTKISLRPMATPSAQLQPLEEWLSEEENASCLLSMCQGIVEMPYKQRRRSSQLQSSNGDSQLQMSRRTSAYSPRRTRLYHNCKLLAPDGQLLSTIDKRKLEWYLQKGLGTIVSEEPLTLKLHFEPAGRPGEDREYYLQNKENICVVCGTEEDCVRKNIVPHEYRRLFPPKMKEHLSHDVLLMCVVCHQMASVHNSRLKQEIENEYSVPVNSSQKFKDDPRLVKVKNHARALLNHGDRLPEDRQKVLLETVAEHFDCEVSEVNQALLERASQVDPKERNSSYVAHAEVVVNSLVEEEQVFEFQRRWRQHFLDTMKPRFLPDLWCVDHNPS